MTCSPRPTPAPVQRINSSSLDCPRMSTTTSSAGPLVSPALQSSRRRPALGQRYSRHLSLSRMDRHEPETTEHSGDLRASKEPRPRSSLEMDRPLKDGQLTLDGGQTIHLTGGANNIYQGHHPDAERRRLSLLRNATTASLYASPRTTSSRPIRQCRRKSPSRVPAGDYRASPIEEVTVGVKAFSRLRPPRHASSLLRQWRRRSRSESAADSGCEIGR